MTTEIPHAVHIAIPRTNRDPKLDHPPVNTYRFSGSSLTEGIEKIEIDGVEGRYIIQLRRLPIVSSLGIRLDSILQWKL